MSKKKQAKKVEVEQGSAMFGVAIKKREEISTVEADRLMLVDIKTGSNWQITVDNGAMFIATSEAKDPIIITENLKVIGC